MRQKKETVATAREGTMHLFKIYSVNNSFFLIVVKNIGWQMTGPSICFVDLSSSSHRVQSGCLRKMFILEKKQFFLEVFELRKKNIKHQ